MMGQRAGRVAALAALWAVLGCAGAPSAFGQSTPAKDLFSATRLPSAQESQTHGFYSHGCISGAVALPADGPTWQAMRLSRNRRWGHPTTIAFLKQFSQTAAATIGWPGLLVGDVSQPRGGPMSSGHASHQVGLDADIWLQPMPERRLTPEEREEFPFRSVLKGDTLRVDDRIWDKRYTGLIALAAKDAKVQRVFVHPGIKKKLCDTVKGDRSWLNKVRPVYGHNEHFHVRLFCQPGSPGCEPQQGTGKDAGCDLDWWFKVALKPAPPGAKKAKPRPPLSMAALPKVCRQVLAAPAIGESAATAVAAAEPSPMALGSVASGGFPPLPESGVPIPAARPFR